MHLIFRSLESKEKDKSHKKHKKHKKEKHKDRESRPTSSHGQEAGEKPKTKEPPKMLNQFTRPSSQNSTTPKLFDPTPFKPEVKKDKSATPKPPSKPDANVSSSSSTSSKPEKKESSKKKKKGGNSDDVWVCPVCSIAYVEGGAEMIGCDSW
jgi:rubrerythrin